MREAPEIRNDPSAAGGDGVVCVNCVPLAGGYWLVPEVTVTALVPAGQSLLVNGLQWYGADDESVSGPEDVFLIVTPTVRDGDK